MRNPSMRTSPQITDKAARSKFWRASDKHPLLTTFAQGRQVPRKLDRPTHARCTGGHNQWRRVSPAVRRCGKKQQASAQPRVKRFGREATERADWRRRVRRDNCSPAANKACARSMLPTAGAKRVGTLLDRDREFGPKGLTRTPEWDKVPISLREGPSMARQIHPTEPAGGLTTTARRRMGRIRYCGPGGRSFGPPRFWPTHIMPEAAQPQYRHGCRCRTGRVFRRLPVRRSGSRAGRTRGCPTRPSGPG